MSRIANALLIQRERQKHALAQQLQVLEQQISALDQSIQKRQQNILSSCTIPAFIRPEIEMARMHYWMNQEQARMGLVADKDELKTQQVALEKQKIEVKTALKILEKHQGRQIEKQQRAMMLTQQNNSDEWIVQRWGDE